MVVWPYVQSKSKNIVSEEEKMEKKKLTKARDLDASDAS